MPTSSTLTARIILSSTTLFPNPSNVDLTAIETVSGSAEFSTVVVPAGVGVSASLYGPSAGAVNQNTTYFYAASPSTNPTTMSLKLTDTNTSSSIIATLRPGDFIYMPLHVNGAGVKLEAVGASLATSSIVNAFWGER